MPADCLSENMEVIIPKLCDLEANVFNLYPLLNSADPTAWLWEFLLELIHNDKTWNVSVTKTSVPRKALAVVQSLADHEPDVDAVFREKAEMEYVQHIVH